MCSDQNGEEGRPRDANGKRVLVLAYACSPYRGSEAGLGWNWVLQISKYCETWVLCKKQKYESEIERYFEENGRIPGLHFCFVHRNRFEKFLKRIGLFYAAYWLWHKRAYLSAVELHKEHRFDLAHQLNICTFREPGFLWKLDVPFVLGPIGGCENYPWRFLLSQAGVRGALEEGSRILLNWLQLGFTPRLYKAVKKAGAVLAVNSNDESVFRRVHRIKTVPMLDVGSTTVVNQKPQSKRSKKGLRILWSGVLVHRKALNLLIMALSRLPGSIEYELRILGDGPLRVRWQELARRTGVDSHCAWEGWITQRDTVPHYNWADVFVFSSLRDSSGTVVLEALSRGVPVICLDHQGVRDMITPQCGIKIPVTTPAEVVSRIRDAIISLAKDPDKLAELSQGALARAGEFLWPHKGTRMIEIYDQVLNDYRTKRVE